MKDRSRKLAVINTGRKPQIETGGTTTTVVHAGIGGGGGGSMNLSDYLLKQIWDKAFEIRTTETGEEYLFGKLNFATQYGITMYANGGLLDLPSIFEGIPFDKKTIWLNPETKLVEVIGSAEEDEGGSADFSNVRESGEGNAFTSFMLSEDGKELTFVKGETFAKQSDFEALNTKVTDFLEGSDTDNIINKWKELEAFLSGMKESDDLATILATKWTKDDAKIANWDAAFGWGDHSKAGYLKKEAIYDESIGCWKLEGDLLVTGGITMYANEGQYTPSTITDAVNIDGNTLIRVNGVIMLNPDIQIGGGGTDIDLSEYAKKSTTLAGYGIADAYTKTEVDNNFVAKTTKDFMKVNGSLTSNVDFNDYYTSGSYNNTTGNGSGNSNTPGNYGVMLVFGDKSGYAAQFHVNAGSTSVKIRTRYVHSGNVFTWSDWNSLAYTTSNVASATRLETPRSIWGQLFDGTDDVSGAIENATTGSFSGNVSMDSATINGGNLTYNATDKYWKLEGDLLVTGGITMFGSDSSFSPSTITQAVNVDGTTIINDGKKLMLNPDIQLGGGGVTDYNDLTNKPDLSVYALKTSLSSYASKSTTLSGYGISDAYTKTESDNKYMLKSSYTANDVLAKLKTVDGAWSGLDADTLDGVHASSLMTFTYYTDYVGARFSSDELSKKAAEKYIEFWGSGCWFNGTWGKLSAVNGFVGNLTGNADTATKLQIARTLWGNSFDGSKDVSGAIENATTGSFSGDVSMESATINGGKLTYDSINKYWKLESSIRLSNGASEVSSIKWELGAKIYSNSSGNLFILSPSSIAVGAGYTGAGSLIHFQIASTGATGIAKSLLVGHDGYLTNDLYSLVVYGDSWYEKSLIVGENVKPRVANTTNVGTTDYRLANVFTTKVDVNGIEINKSADGVLYIDGNLSVSGGITMYSDLRKKTILNHVELSLKEVAEAPLIEHYYNSDESKRTHVGSVAQYWAGLNDWFCKEDGEGFLTMEIQNAALASAISVARELTRYESKTDKQIKKLKKRIGELEEEIENLKKV